jgi:hypothetical protein
MLVKFLGFSILKIIIGKYSRWKVILVYYPVKIDGRAAD